MEGHRKLTELAAHLRKQPDVQSAKITTRNGAPAVRAKISCLPWSDDPTTKVRPWRYVYYNRDGDLID